MVLFSFEIVHTLQLASSRACHCYDLEQGVWEAVSSDLDLTDGDMLEKTGVFATSFHLEVEDVNGI